MCTYIVPKPLAAIYKLLYRNGHVVVNDYNKCTTLNSRTPDTPFETIFAHGKYVVEHSYSTQLNT